MKQGIYKIESLVHDGPKTARKHVGRLAVVNGHTQVLEDTRDGFLAQSFPDGLVDDRKQRRWMQMQASPYFSISTEGILGDDAKPVDQPQVKPEEIFSVIDDHGAEQHLEAYGDTLFLDGRRLTDEGVEDLKQRIQSGALHLLPRMPS